MFIANGASAETGLQMLTSKTDARAARATDLKAFVGRPCSPQGSMFSDLERSGVARAQTKKKGRAPTCPASWVTGEVSRSITYLNSVCVQALNFAQENSEHCVHGKSDYLLE